MVWFFERGKESLRIETTHDKNAGTFTLKIFAPDGTPQVQTFTTNAAFREGLVALERRLLAENWISSGSALLGPETFGEPN
jgi:hypothetical protein